MRCVILISKERSEDQEEKQQKAEDIVAMEVNSLAFVMEKEMRVIGCTVVILDALFTSGC